MYWRHMVKNTGSPEDTLINDILRLCIDIPASSSENQQPVWDELAVLKDLSLLECIVGKWKKDLSKSEMLICPVGKSGLAIGAMTARLFGQSMIWIDGDGRVIPQSREIEGKEIAVMDFHSFQGAHFSMAHSRLIARGASKVDFFCAVNCDHVEERLQLPDLVQTVISVSDHEQLFFDRFRELGFDNKTLVVDCLASGDFWGRRVT